MQLSHPDRVNWPELGLTKGYLAAYYESLAPVLLPHLHDRPFTVKQHYTVPRGPFRWLKGAPPDLPPWVPVSPQPAKSRGGPLSATRSCGTPETLRWLVDFGVVDLHVWPSRVDRPDYVLFDLDPAGVELADVVAAALLLRAALESARARVAADDDRRRRPARARAGRAAAHARGDAVVRRGRRARSSRRPASGDAGAPGSPGGTASSSTQR